MPVDEEGGRASSFHQGQSHLAPRVDGFAGGQPSRPPFRAALPGSGLVPPLDDMRPAAARYI